MRVLVLGVAFTDVKGFPFGRYDPVGTNKGSVKLTHGGVARNVAEDLARLGCDVVFPLPVDRTPLGHDIKARLEEAGVDMSEAISVPDGGTGMWLAVFNEKGDLAGSISKMPDVAPIENKLDSDGDRLFGACDAVVAEFDTSEAIAEKTVALAEKHGKDLYCIVGNMSVMLAKKELLARTRCVIMNVIEAGRLLGADIRALEPNDAQTLVWAAGQSLGLKAIIVTMGAKGAVYADFSTGESGVMPPAQCEVVDTTGAGDAFFSAAVMTISRGLGIYRACLLGTQVAARVISTSESACPEGCAGLLGD